MAIDAKLVLGIAGNATAILMFLSPAPAFFNIIKKKSTQSFSGLPYVVTIFNCLLWVLYGLPLVIKNGMLVLTINGAGVAIEVVYITLFLIYSDRMNRVKVTRLLSTVLATYATIVTITLTAIQHQPTRKLAVGSICVVVTTAMYVAPLSVMKMVLKTKSVEFMPFFLSVFCFVNSSVWTAYAVFAKDIFIMIPNVLGALLGATQLVLHILYRRNKASPEPPVEQDIEVNAVSTKTFVTNGFESQLAKEFDVNVITIQRPVSIPSDLERLADSST